MKNKILEGHVGIFELTGLLTIAVASKGFLTIPRTAMITNLHGGWLIIASAIIFTMAGFYLLNKLYQRFPRMAIDDIFRKVLGKWMGNAAVFTIVLFFIFFIIINLREFAELVIGSILPNTPLSQILAIFMLVVIYGCFKGIENITRAAWMKTPVMVMAFILIIILSVPSAKLDNMYPILGRGIFTGVKAGLISVSRFAEGLLCLGILIPFIRERKEVTKIGYGFVFFSGIFILSCTVIYQMIFGIPSGITNGTFPLYKVTRLISFGSFFQRVEAVFIFIWIIFAVYTVTITFYCLNLVIARQLNLPTFRPLLMSMGVLIYAISFLPTDFVSTVALEMRSIRLYGGIPALGIPILVLIIAKIRGIKGGNDVDEKPKA